MPFKVVAQIAGVKELHQLLQVEAPKAVNRASRRGVTKAAREVRKDARQRTPVRTGLLKRSLDVKVKTYPSGVVVGVVGPATGFKTDKATGKKVRTKLGEKIKETGINPVKYAHLVELGTKRSKARPFLRPALDANREKATAILAAEYMAELTKVRAKGS